MPWPEPFDSDATYLLPDAYLSIYGRSALENLACSRELSEKEQASIRDMLNEINNPEQRSPKDWLTAFCPWIK